MGVSRIRRVRTAKKKELEKVLKVVIYPPAIAAALAVQSVKNKKRVSKTEKKP